MHCSLNKPIINSTLLLDASMQAKQFTAMKLNWLTENNSILVTSTVVALANFWKSSNYWRQKFLINQISQLYKQWSKLLSRRRELCNVKRPSNSATEKIKVIWRIMRTASTLQHSIAAVSFQVKSHALHIVCCELINLEEETLKIIERNPQSKRNVSHVFRKFPEGITKMPLSDYFCRQLSRFIEA